MVTQTRKNTFRKRSVCLHITSVSIDERGRLRQSRELLGHSKTLGREARYFGGGGGGIQKRYGVRSLNLKLGAKGEGVGRVCALPLAISMTLIASAEKSAKAH